MATHTAKLPATIRSLMKAALGFVKPPEFITVSEWADKYRFLSPESSASAGKWKTSKAEYQRGVMDSLSEKGVKEVVIMSSAQVGKTSFVENIIGRFAHIDPCPIMIVNPTVEMAQTFSTDRLATMIRDTPCLSKVFGNQKTRNNSNKILKKTFRGGVLTMVGANSPSTLASRPIRLVLMDEVDRFPASAGTEGDPVNLAKKRTITFWNALIVMVSTPTLKNTSRIETAFLQTDQRYFFIKCLHCDHEQRLVWSQVKWENDDPMTAKYYCAECHEGFTDTQRYRMIRKGRWIASMPFKGSVGFHLNEMYSSWRKISDIADDFLKAKGNPETMKTFINTSLGETYEEDGDQADYTVLMKRVSNYGDDQITIKGMTHQFLPKDVLCITVGADIQADRIEFEVVGWGLNDRSWSLGYEILAGNTTEKEVWESFSEHLKRCFYHPTGRLLNIDMVFVDSGYNTSHVYEFSDLYSDTFLKPVKGMVGKKAIVENRDDKAKRLKRSSAKRDIELIGTDNAKHVVHAYLQVNDPDSDGYCNFSTPYNDEEYFMQITAEKRVTKFIRGFPVLEWTKTRPRNEAVDCRCYALAAFKFLNIDLKQRYDLFFKKDVNAKDVVISTKPKRKRRTRVKSN